MQIAEQKGLKRLGKRFFHILLCAMLLFQTVAFPSVAHAASAFAFQGYNNENITDSTFTFSANGASVSGTTVSFSAVGTGEAVGLITLNEEGADITTAVDLGGLEIDFSTVAATTLETENNSEVDVPSVAIKFVGDSENTLKTVSLGKSNPAEAGSETLSSGASIPAQTREIYIYLYGASTSGSNTVAFSDTSLVIGESAAPTCAFEYNPAWTNQPVAVRINAADSDSGLKGIYLNGQEVSTTSPYDLVVSSNNTTLTAYSLDNAGKKSDVQTITINNIDTLTPANPASLSLSATDWTNADVSLILPTLPASSGAPDHYVYKIGTGSWTLVPDGFAISNNGSTTISVAVQDEAGNRSGSLQAIAKIDKLAPVIDSLNTVVSSGSCRVDLTYHEEGLSGLKNVLYATGTQSADYFTTGGNVVTGGTFTVHVGGDYTICLMDNAGNTALQTVTLSTAPVLGNISDVTVNEDTLVSIPLNASDAESDLASLSITATTDNTALLPSLVISKGESGAKLDILPGTNQNGGPATVTVVVEDPQGEETSDTFALTVLAVNDPPSATNDSGITLNEDSNVTIDVLANDTDVADLDTLSIQSCGDPAHGTAIIVLGKIRYTPNADYVGGDSFSYTVSDGHDDGTATATVTVTVLNANDAPVAADDTATVSEDGAVTIAVLENDSDIDLGIDPEETMTISSLQSGANGSTKIDGNTVVYTPTANFFGTDTFTYTISDHAGNSDTATVTVTVAPEADDPVFVGLNDTYSINEDTSANEITFSIRDVETPKDSIMLQAASLNTAKIEQSGVTISGLGDDSDAVKLLVTPMTNQYGEAKILLSLGDGFTTVTRTITIQIQNVNDAPRVVTDTVSFAEDTEYIDILISDLLKNDSDVEGSTLSFGSLLTQPGSGEVKKLSDTTLRYIPVADFDGETSFTYSVSDGTDTSTATCKLVATGSNDAPTITFQYDTATGTEDTLSDAIPFTISDKESSASSLILIGSSANTGVVAPGGFTITNNGNGTGTLRVLPEADAHGTLNITLTVSDGEAQSSDSVSLTIGPAADAPIGEDDEVFVHYSSSFTFGVLDNDHDVDNETLHVSGHSATGLPGTLTFHDATQQFTYSPAIGENGDKTFTYTVSDGTSEDTATVTLHVKSVTHDPVLSPINSHYVVEDKTISGIPFTVSDEDVGDTFTITVSSGDTSKLLVDASHVSVTSLGSGEYRLSLTPVADSTGSVSVTVTATDAAGNHDSTTFTLHILGQNDAPVAKNDAQSLNEDNSAVLDLLTNDSDADGDPIWVTTVSTPTHGYLTRSGNTITYTPYAQWNGTETLTYAISDGRATASASIALTILPVNDAPIAWNDYVALPNEIGQAKTDIKVLGNDYDSDGDTVHTYRIVSQPMFGSVSINPDGTISYTRTAVSTNPNGADSFTYSIIDRADEAATDKLSATAMVTIGIQFHSSLYTYGRDVTCYEDCAPVEFTLDVSNPTPVDYTLTFNTACTLGTLSVKPGTTNTVIFTPYANAFGSQNITYTVADAENKESDTGTIWLTVYPVNDAPVIDSAPTTVSTQEDATIPSSFDVTFHDIDCSRTDLHFYVYTKTASTSAPVVFQTWYSTQVTSEGKTVTVHPLSNVNGTGVIVVGVSDGFTYAEQTIDLTIVPQDDTPIINNITKTIREDSSVRFAALSSDYEVDGDDTTVTIGTPSHGTATLRADDTILYTPNADYYGTDSFSITVTDLTTAAKSATATATITVLSVNDQPAISNLGYYQTTPEDTSKTVTLTVSDVDNDMTQSTSYSFTTSDKSIVEVKDISIAHGTGNGMIITVKPMENAFGTVLISVTASDGLLSAKSAFQLVVTPVNDKPIAVDDEATVSEAVSDGTESTPPKTTKTMDLLSNDSDVEGGTLRIVAITNVKNGTVVNAGSGQVTVTAFNGDFNGDITFNYTVMDPDGETASASAKLIVTPSNDPPRTGNDSVTIDEDAIPTVSVLTNDSDPEGEALTVTAVSNPGHGTASYTGTSVTYTPTKDYNGKDSFTYTVTDASGATSTATVSITIRPVNDAPVIAKHALSSGDWTMFEDVPKSFHFVVSDAESAVNNLIIRISSEDGTLIKTSQIQLSTNATGYKTIYVVPNPDAHGTVNIDFSVSDGLETTTAVYPITIQSVNDAPVVTPMSLSVKEDSSLKNTATATDVDKDNITFSLVEEHAPIHGTVVVQSNGAFTYTPDANYNGVDLFEIAANDGQPENNIGKAYITINVLRENDPPTAVDDAFTLDEDTPTPLNVLANDTDEDVAYGDKLSILRISTTPTKGTATIADGKILYTPKLNQNGTDTLSYVIADQDGKLDTADVTITIKPVNDPPANGNDTATTNEDTPISISVLVNDDVDVITNPALEHLTIVAVEQPDNGTASINPDGQGITYTPNANYFSPSGTPDVFYYAVQDSGSPMAVNFSVSVTVLPVNDIPTLTAATENGKFTNVTLNEDTVSGSISFTVSDVEDLAKDLIVTVTHNNGVLLPPMSATPNASGVCSFVIDSYDNKIGSGTITVKVKDSAGASAEQTFTVTIDSVNDAPNAQNDEYSLPEATSITKNVLENDDVDTLTGNGGDELTLLGFLTDGDTVVPTLNTIYGTASISNNQLVYTHTAKTADKGNCSETFQYRMQDKLGFTSTATVKVTITPSNDAPTITNISNPASMLEDTADGTGELAFEVTDEEDDDDGLVINKTSSNTTLVPLTNITITNPDSTTDPSGSKRTVKVVPAANQFGTSTIGLTVRDAEGRTAYDEFTVTVTSVNDAPQNGNDTATTNEDTPILLSVLTNDDVDLVTNSLTEKLTITAVTQPAHGTAAISTDSQKITYTPSLNYFSPTNTPDTFTYTVHDNGTPALEATFTVSVTVKPVNDAPTIDFRGLTTYTVPEKIPVENILFYISDVDHNTDLSLGNSQVTVTAKSSNTILFKDGLTLTNGSNSDRYLKLQPNGEWNGTAYITITATDAAGAKATYKFTVVVSNVNAAPTAVADTLSVLEDVVSNINVLSNDTDPDLITNPTTEKIFVNSVSTTSTNATVSISTDEKSIVVDPIDNYNGTFTITYSIKDVAGLVSNNVVSTITVTQVNDAPAPVADTKEMNEDDTLPISVLENDKDVDQTTGLNANPTAEVLSASIAETTLLKPAHGSISISNNVITYDSNDNFNGTDTFEYYCNDGEAKTKALVSVTVHQINDNPVAVKDVSNVEEDHTASKDVVLNDTDVDTLEGTNATPDSLNDLALTFAQLTSGSGTVTTSGNTITFKPNDNWVGTATVSYVISDKHEGTAESVYEINVASVNDLPVFATTPANMNLTEDSDNGTSALAVTDVETPYADLNVTLISSSNTTLVDGSGISISSSGEGDRTITVNPKDNQNGSSTIKLRVTDGDDGYTEVTFVVNVTAVNDAPTALITSATTAEDNAKTVNVSSLIGDVDIVPNSDAITVSVATGDGPVHGTYSVTGTQITYTPTTNFNGTDSIFYTVTDKAGLTARAKITLTVTAVNDRPTPANDIKITNEDTLATIDVLANDTDVDSDSSLNATPVYTKTVVGVGTAAHGTTAYTAGQVTYQPSANFNGTDSFTYTMRDGALTATATVTVTINSVNDNPIAVKDVSNVDEDHTASMNVVLNDTDVDTEADKNLATGALQYLVDMTLKTYSLTTGSGTVSNVGNTITFTPTTNWFGKATVSYTVEDKLGGTSDGVYEINVASINDLPLFATSPVNMNLTEDSDNGTSALAVTDVETPYEDLNVTYQGSTNPTLVDGSCVSIAFDGDGNRTVTVDPKLNQNGSATITLRVTDGNTGYTEKTFTVTVTSVNDAPTAQVTSATTAEDYAKTIDVASLIGDVDIATDKDVITVSVAEGDGPAHGTCSLSGTQITYTPATNFNGADSIFYTVTDKAGLTARAKITLTVTQVNDAPSPVNDTAEVNEDETVPITVLGNDKDTDQTAGLNADPNAEVLSASISEADLAKPAHGSVSIASGVITYDPADNFNGTDTFEYYCKDGEAKTKATVTVTIKQVNDAPVAKADTTTTREDTAVTYNVLSNDTDVDTDTALNLATPQHAKTEFSITKITLTDGTNGTASYSGGSITFTPSKDYVGTQVISYEMSDGHGLSSSSTLSVIVGSEDDSPVAGNDEMTTTEDHAVTINVLDNDADSDIGDALRFDGFVGSVASLPGAFSTNANGSVTFTPNANYNGSFTVDYYVADSTNLTDVGTISISVSAVNDVPVALDTSAITAEDTAKTIDVASLISDADIETNGDSIQVTVAAGDGPAHGSYTLSGTQFTYTPTADFNGTDQIIYTVTDTQGAKDTGTISLTILAVNDQPTTKNDSATTAEDTLVTIDVLDNDADVDTESALNLAPAAKITIDSVGVAAHGTTKIVSGEITYQPNANYNGSDSFTYTVTDGALTKTDNVSVSISQVNDSIVAKDDEATTPDEDLVTIDVLKNDTDVDTDPANNLDTLHSRDDFVLTAVGTASNGSTKIVGGKIAYTPEDRFAGKDSFTYTVSDGHGSSKTATVTVTVVSTNDAPLILEVPKPMEGTKAIPPDPVRVSWTSFDIDGDELTYSLEYFDGKDWLSAASGLTKAEYDFAIPTTLKSTNGLKFRVTAFDGVLTSDYGYSGAIKVDKDAPTGSVVSMRTADGRAYTAGTWTNQNVIVQASSAVDASVVSYYYSFDGGAEELGDSMSVTSGVHTINVTARDEFKNQTPLGGYLARVDKLPPAIPQMRESILGAGVVITFTLQADPGGSGNDTLLLPDGTTLRADGTLQFTATKNGTYSFTLIDAVGNRRMFSYAVSSADTSKPQITFGSGAYRVGTKTKSNISVSLTFTDNESTIAARGYQLSTNASPSGAYRNYDGVIVISNAGTFYIHAFARNAFGITAYETFGPFILEEVAQKTDVTPTPQPVVGNVVVTTEDIQPSATSKPVAIRLPGKDWSETLTLEGVEPGDYLVEVMDEQGNIQTTTVHVTAQDIYSRSLRGRDSTLAIVALAVAAAVAILLLLLFAGYNVIVTVVNVPFAEEKKIRAMRRIMFEREEFVIKLKQRHVQGGRFAKIKIAKHLTKKMRGNWVIVEIKGVEVLREQVPEDANEAFRRKITLE